MFVLENTWRSSGRLRCLGNRESSAQRLRSLSIERSVDTSDQFPIINIVNKQTKRGSPGNSSRNSPQKVNRRKTFPARVPRETSGNGILGAPRHRRNHDESIVSSDLSLNDQIRPNYPRSSVKGVVTREPRETILRSPRCRFYDGRRRDGNAARAVTGPSVPFSGPLVHISRPPAFPFHYPAPIGGRSLKESNSRTALGREIDRSERGEENIAPLFAPEDAVNYW